ncbi:hypothetical protein [Methanospirillum hungatei]|uniref:hypothetical protein n=1 Tax=Methanospirillum hungatei TaxID=2203 RepID=UPI0026EE6B3E|nr:hypothetical protein [Methanospirillum hungatei]MCA1917294.1 hypothetical protein [Methanospirillum hungatei]
MNEISMRTYRDIFTDKELVRYNPGQTREEKKNAVSPTDDLAWRRITEGDYSYIILALEKPTHVSSGLAYKAGCGV